MRKSLWVALLLVLLMAMPQESYAREIDYLQSFSNGFETLKGNGSNEQVTPERDYNESYEPSEVVLSAPPAREYDEDSTTVDYVNGTVDSFNRIDVGVNTWNLQYAVGWFLGNSGSNGSPFGWGLIATAIGIVFMWWGVRKAKSIIWTAFRTGRLNLGTSVKRAYYRRKAREWYG